MTADGGQEAALRMLDEIGVSRETFDRLETYVALLTSWTARINLVSKSTVSNIWDRHIVDSLQLVPLAPKAPSRWLDLGSGGGLPGLVCAIVLAECSPSTQVTLVESDARKVTFLQTACRSLGLETTLLRARVETLAPQRASVITARAVAPLSRLFELAERHADPNTLWLLPKGARFADEIAAAELEWRFTVTACPSITDDNSRILRCTLGGRRRTGG